MILIWYGLVLVLWARSYSENQPTKKERERERKNAQIKLRMYNEAN